MRVTPLVIAALLAHHAQCARGGMRVTPLVIAALLVSGAGSPVLAQAMPTAQTAPVAARDFASGRIAVTVEGQGSRDLILIPGLSSSPRVWDDVVKGLEPGTRVHRIQVRGFAGLEPQDNATGSVAAPVVEEIARYIETAGLNAPAVVGHSMGGTIALMLAARHPQAVGRVMVVDQVPFMGAMFAQPGTNPTVEAVTPTADMIHAQMLSGPEDAYRAQADQAITGMIRTEDRRAFALEDARTSDRATSANAFRELVVTDLRPELSRITVPVQVLYVAFDFPGMTPEMTDAIYHASYQALPSARLTRIDDSAHFIMIDQPDRFQDALDAFLSAD